MGNFLERLRINYSTAGEGTAGSGITNQMAKSAEDTQKVINPTKIDGIVQRLREAGEYTISEVDYRYGYIQVIKGIKRGIINDEGEMIVPCEYKNVYYLGEGLFKLIEELGPNYKYGIVNKQGEEILPCEYDEILKFFQNTYLVIKYGEHGNNKHGVIGLDGSVIIDCEYESVDEFLLETFKVKRDGKYGLRRGKKTLPCEYSDIKDKKGFIELQKDGKYGFANADLEEIVPCEYDCVYEYPKGLDEITKYQKYGLIIFEGEKMVARESNNESDFFTMLGQVNEMEGGIIFFQKK